MGRTPRGTWALSEEAAALVEYVLLIALIAIAALTGMRNLGTSANDSSTTVAQAVDNREPDSGNPNDGKDGDDDGNAGGGNNRTWTAQR